MAADEAKRTAKQQEVIMSSQANNQAAQQPAPQNVTQAILQRPGLSRGNSGGLLGNIFQGFVRAASATPSASPSQSPTPTNRDGKGATGVNPVSLTAEIEKLRSERMRDVDIVRSALIPFY